VERGGKGEGVGESRRERHGCGRDRS
jgi:hypothetical protein